MKMSLFVRSVVRKNQKGSFHLFAAVRQVAPHPHHVPQLADFPEHHKNVKQVV